MLIWGGCTLLLFFIHSLTVYWYCTVYKLVLFFLFSVHLFAKICNFSFCGSRKNGGHRWPKRWPLSVTGTQVVNDTSKEAKSELILSWFGKPLIKRYLRVTLNLSNFSKEMNNNWVDLLQWRRDYSLVLFEYLLYSSIQRISSGRHCKSYSSLPSQGSCLAIYHRSLDVLYSTSIRVMKSPSSVKESEERDLHDYDTYSLYKRPWNQSCSTRARVAKWRTTQNRPPISFI